MKDSSQNAYINDYIYFMVRPAPDRGDNSWIYCSGVNVTRFSRLTKGRHGLSSNPAIRGLQLIKHNVSRLSLSKCAHPILIRGRDCSGIAPTHEMWYTEILLIEDAPSELPAAVIDFCSLDVFSRIIQPCCPSFVHPGKSMSADELQVFMDRLIAAS